MAPSGDDGRDDAEQDGDVAGRADGAAQPAFVPTVLIPIGEVCRRTSLGKTMIHELVREGRFPQPVAIAGRRRGYVESEVEAWLQARMAERHDPADVNEGSHHG